jgi:aminopeptidase N
MTKPQNHPRYYDVVHYKIEVSFDEAKKLVFGKAATTFVPLKNRFDTLSFDAVGLNVKKISMANGTKLKFKSRENDLWIKLDRGYSTYDTITVTTEYWTKPEKGLYFVQPDSGFPQKPQQIWTQGEGEDNRYWFPCYDYPDEKATSELIATVRNTYSVLSNGRLVDVLENVEKGTKTFHWKMEKPHASYLVMMAAGNYAILKDSSAGIPLEYWVYPTQLADAKVCFSETPNILKFFSNRLDYRYPWNKYSQVLIADFQWGGMENTTATTLKDEIAVYDARARLDNNPRGLIAHEMSHMWYGDLVTCKSWRHLWLNEGFASYLDLVYQQSVLGEEEFRWAINNSQQQGINSDAFQGRRPIVSDESYPTNLYPRGASVLHMLRFVVGEEKFWKGMQHYLNKHQFTSTETNDFRIAMEEIAGEKLDWFFDEWLYKAGYPKFEISYVWNESQRQIELHVAQVQSIDSLTGIFRMPINIGITDSTGKRIVRVEILSQDTVFHIKGNMKPLLVQFDDGGWLIKKVRFEKSNEEWIYQAEFADHPVDRIKAIEELGSNEERSFEVLMRIARNDHFWAVRQNALGAMNETSKKNFKTRIEQLLIDCSSDPRPSIRYTAVSYLGDYPGDNILRLLENIVETDSSYNVVAEAIKSIVSIDSAKGFETAKKNINRVSHQNIICNASLAILGEYGGIKAIPYAIKFASYGNRAGTRTIAMRILSRYGKGNEEVYNLYVQFLNDPHENIRLSAVATLADFGSSKVIPLLQKVGITDKSPKVVKAANDACNKLKVEDTLK